MSRDDRKEVGVTGSNESPTERELRATIRAATKPPVAPGVLGRAIAPSAAGSRLLDCAYCEIDSPVGRLLLAATPAGVVQISYLRGDRDDRLAGLAAALGPRMLEAPGALALDRARRELDEYFDGRRRGFELPLDWRLSRGFVRRVLERTARIPYGEVRSYAEIAAEAGSPRAYRAAGSALGANPIPIVVPCHRVLRTGGALGGYGGGLPAKRTLLDLEASRR